MPFGLTNAPAVFKDHMSRSFHEYLDTRAVIFIDDILMYFKDEHEHEKYLRLVLDVMRKQKWSPKLSKWEFWLKDVAFLFHVISKEGVKVDPSKIKIVVEWVSPKNVSEVWGFLGFASYYRQCERFLQDCAAVDQANKEGMQVSMV